MAGTNTPDARYRYTVDLGVGHFRLGELPHAITAYERALNLSPPAERWKN